MRKWYMRMTACVAALALLAGCGVAAGESAPKAPTAAAVKYADDVHNAEVAANVKVLAAAEWYQAAYEADVARFLEAVAAKAAADAQAAYEAAHRPKAPAAAPKGSTVVSVPAASNVGGACGGASNGADAYIGRESGGNPNARNASGAWGCYQIMPGTWSSSCSDLGQHGSASTQAQAQCASRLPSSSWAASGG